MTESASSTDSLLNRIQMSRERTQYLGAMTRLPRSIALAEVGVLPFGELIDRLAGIWTEGDPPLLVDQILKRERTDDQQLALLRVIERLAAEADGLVPRDRHVADRAIYRLLHTLPKPLAGALARRCAESKRSLQRQAAYRFYKAHGVDSSAIGIMLDDYRRRPHQDILEIIARDPQAVAQADPEFLLRELDERYWRTRVFQVLLRSDRHLAESLALQYPTELLWAAGREGDVSTLPLLRRLLVDNNEDPEFVGWCLWAFSKLGSGPDVAVARLTAESLMAGVEPWIWGREGSPSLPSQDHAA